MKFVIVNEVNGGREYRVAEADTPIGAMHEDMLVKSFNDKEYSENDEVVTVGVYEVGAVNHLQEIQRIAEIHRYYRDKIQSLGFNPNTYEEEK